MVCGAPWEKSRTFASYPKRGDIDFTDCKTQKDKIADRGACIPMWPLIVVKIRHCLP